VKLGSFAEHLSGKSFSFLRNNSVDRLSDNRLISWRLWRNYFVTRSMINLIQNEWILCRMLVHGGKKSV